MIPEEITKDQKKKVNKILFRSFLSIGFIGLKFSLSLFALNLFCFFLGVKFLVDAAPEIFIGFVMVSCFINVIFLYSHFNLQFKSIHESVEKQIKEVFKSE